MKVVIASNESIDTAANMAGDVANVVFITNLNAQIQGKKIPYVLVRAAEANLIL